MWFFCCYYFYGVGFQHMYFGSCYPRSLRYLKQYARIKAWPEGSNAKAYIINESLDFYSMYLRGIETRFNKGDQNNDSIDDNEINNRGLSIFFQHIRWVRWCPILTTNPWWVREITLVYSKQLWWSGTLSSVCIVLLIFIFNILNMTKKLH